MAKSRLAPLKRISIPRLELLACVLGARLYHFIVEALDIQSISTYFWTDSSTALAWIQRNDQWGTFVGNRVKEICQLSKAQQWFFVPGHLNPADLPSRGCNPQQFLTIKWWEGPAWLREIQDRWPNENISPDENAILVEKRKGVTVNLYVTARTPEWYERFSSFFRIVRIFAWIRRFIKGSQKRQISKSESISVSEIQEAENALWYKIQKENFPKTSNSVHGLMVIEDEARLIRVKTKIVEREDEFSFRYPILLPTKHYLVTCLITNYHVNNCHAGVLVLASKLREKYWIISSKRIIRNVIQKCNRCKRFTAKALSTPPIHLPLDRVRDAAVFEITGIDLCGPLFLKNKSKVWIVLFTCAVYRAVHLEIVSSLTTDVFIQSLRRFIARRGRPLTIYTDNGTNFTGTYHILKNVNWKKVVSNERLSPIKFKFIPPTAAWWGGWWERLIRSVKALLVRVLGRSSLSCEELYTVLCDVEATVNSRPLTYISDGAEDFNPLTPAMFLQDTVEIGTPDLDSINQKKLALRYSYCQQLREELRSRFRKEYLGQLVQKANGKFDDIKIGDVVLIGIDNQKRLNWPMAKVLKILPSRDGQARVVKLKTKNGTLVRPLQRLYPLEISSTDVICQQQEKRSRSGRLLKPPERL